MKKDFKRRKLKPPQPQACMPALSVAPQPPWWAPPTFPGVFISALHAQGAF